MTPAAFCRLYLINGEAYGMGLWDGSCCGSCRGGHVTGLHVSQVLIDLTLALLLRSPALLL